LTPEGRRVLDTADVEVERRLSDIAAHRPDGEAAAFAGLEPWREALDAYRAARRAGTAPRAGAAARAGTAPGETMRPKAPR
jgi:hypothetical protein